MEVVEKALFDSYVKNFEKYPLPVCLLNVGTIIFLNNECKKLLDVKDDVSSDNLDIKKFIHEEYKELVNSRLKNRELGLSVPAQINLKISTLKKTVDVNAVTLDLPIGKKIFTHVIFSKLNDFNEQQEQIKKEDTNIRSNLNFLNSLIDTIPNPVYYKNVEGVYIGCNQAFVDFMGVGKEKLLGKLPHDVPQIILANIYHDGDMDLIKNNKSEVYEGKARDITGEIKDVIYHKTVFFDSESVVGGMVCTIIDITKQKQAKKALKESEVRVKLALEASMLGLWDLNLSKHEIFLSPEYYIILGYAPNEFKPKIEEWLSSFYNSENEPVELLNGPLPTIREKIDGKEYKIKTKSGQFKWILLKGKIVEQRYTKYDYRITGTIRDISAQKEAEIAVQESELRFRMVLESSNDAIAIIENKSQLVYWNKRASELFKTTQEELNKFSGFSELFSEKEWTRLNDWLANLSKDSDQHLFETSMQASDGNDIPVKITVSPIYLERKRNFVFTIKDLSSEIKALEEKKKLEEQLRHAQKMETIGTLAGGIAHDFNNILTPILGYTQMAMADLPPDSTMHEDLEHVFMAATRARDLVKQILTFSRRLETEKVNIYVHLIVNEVIGLISATIPANIKIEKKIHSKMDVVNIAPTQLHQVIMNMCTNAYQAMKNSAGVLTLELDVLNELDSDLLKTTGLAQGAYVLLKIRDTGQGIEESLLSRIFEPFFTTKGVGEGTGLGLSVAHGIISDSKGTILVNSEINKGTEFSIFLPHVNELPKEVKKVSHEKIQTNLNALVVDDDKEVLNIVVRSLESMGFNVDSSNSSVEAVNIIGNNPTKYNILVTDQIMPDIQGVDLVQLLKSTNPQAKAVLITGYSATITDEEAKKIGVDKFLMKPIIIDKLAEAILDVIAN